MYDFRASSIGHRVPLWADPPRSQPLRSDSIRIDETALCLDCQVMFNVRNRVCPKCDGQQFWLVANWKPTRAALPVACA